MLSPTQLNNYLACHHLAHLEHAAREGVIEKNFALDPMLELIRQQGQEHEEAYLEELREKYGSIEEIEQELPFENKVIATEAAIEKGIPVIYQGALSDGEWKGYPDFLVIDEELSENQGRPIYNIQDTKLSNTVKGAAIIQLSIYAELLEKIQGIPPRSFTIVSPNNRSTYFPGEFSAYLRYVKSAFAHGRIPEDLENIAQLVVEPTTHCTICDWRQHCEKRWHETDHLKLVAGLSRSNRRRLQQNHISTLADLGSLDELPEIKDIPAQTFEKNWLQAKIQLKAREEQTHLKEFILPIQENQGLASLPTPDEGDIWFDIEGNPHILKEGLEYLWGWCYRKGTAIEYTHHWAMNPQDEKEALRSFIAFVDERLTRHPKMHIYHYGHHETDVIKRLSTRYNVLVDAVDRMLRSDLFIDLHRAVKNGLRASVERYGLKELEPHHQFGRSQDLTEAGRARKEASLAINSTGKLPDDCKKIVVDYNREDCESTQNLHQWLEACREELEGQIGEEIPRPTLTTEEDREDPVLVQVMNELYAHLVALLPDDPTVLNNDEQAIQNLADLLLYYRREEKANYWEFFRLRELTESEFRAERKALGGPFTYVGVETKDGLELHKWNFEEQDYEASGDNIYFAGLATEQYLEKKIASISLEEHCFYFTIQNQEQATFIAHSRGCFPRLRISNKRKYNQLAKLAIGVIDEETIHANSNRLLGCLLNPNQKLTIQSNGRLKSDSESTLDAAIRLAKELGEGDILPIQGPPGTGKTFTAAHMILALIKEGKKVGVTAQSHAVVRNVLDKVVEITTEEGRKIRCVKQQRFNETRDDYPPSITPMTSTRLLGFSDFDVLGATSFHWTKEENHRQVDVLFIDEAGQFALADAVVSSHAASSLVLLGDPSQLDNVTQGVHPPNIDKSVLGYWLGEETIIGDDQGLFLEFTFRMAPGVTDFISKAFYKDELQSREDLANQRILNHSVYSGSGIRYLACEHIGNSNKSLEEADAVVKLVESFLDGKASWQDKDGTVRVLTADDILIVAPYNAQVNELHERLPEIKVGTVDKFQGREAPIVIYSMATSSPDEAPRGMDFLYSLNRLNVAISRAKCLAILVASPALFDVNCNTPDQMRMANAFCLYLEQAKAVVDQVS